MPTSITPPPKDDEVECGNCGVYLVNPFPHIDLNEQPPPRPKNKLALWFESLMRKLRKQPHVAEELFSGALREASLFDELLRKVGGDRSVVERLIEYERGQKPDATRLTCIQTAITRWERENK